MKYLLPKVDRYFKTNLHSHSNVTDGRLSPEELKEHYKKHGYSILSVTDHNVVADHSHLNDADFLMLTGAEYNINRSDYGAKRLWSKTFHLNFLAKRPDILWQPFRPKHPMDAARPYLELTEDGGIPWECDLETINTMIAEGNRHGYLVTMNHPNASLLDYEDYMGLEGLWAMEIANFDASRSGRDRYNDQILTQMLNRGQQIFPVAADDVHAEASACGAWVMVGARKLEYGSVIDALEKGDFYASTGSEIHELTIEGGKLHIRCSDAQYIFLNSGTNFSKRVAPKAPDMLLREATVDLSGWISQCSGNDPREWIRVTVWGPYGNYAASRAYFRNELCE